MGLMFYKTNEETTEITLDEFVNEWYDNEEYLLIDIRERSDKQNLIQGSFNITYSEIPDKIEMAPTYIVCVVVSDDLDMSSQIAAFTKNHDLNNIFYLSCTTEELFEAIPQLRGNQC